MVERTDNSRSKYPLIILVTGDIVSIAGLVISLLIALEAGFDTTKIEGLFANIIAFGTMAIIFSCCSFLVHRGVSVKN